MLSISRGTRLRLLRDAKGIDQKDAAAAIGISRAYLSMLEGDKKGSRLQHIRSTMERAASFYGVLPEYLLAETAQEYARVFVSQACDHPGLTTVGKRLSFVLDELQLRWGHEFSDERVSDDLGVDVQTLKDYKADGIPIDNQIVLARLSEVTGVPLEFWYPRQASRDEDPAIRRIIQRASEHGIPPEELESLVNAWIVARGSIKRPAG